MNLLQGVICLQRKVATKDHKLVYLFAGAASALSALIEKKSRRSELALYTLPRAGDSLWYILVNRHILPNIKHAEVSVLLDMTSELQASVHCFLPVASLRNADSFSLGCLGLYRWRCSASAWVVLCTSTSTNLTQWHLF